MTINNRGVVGSRRQLRVLHAAGLQVLVVMALMLVMSCTKEKPGDSSTGRNTMQKFEGSLPVRIVPESPTVSADIHAQFVKSSGVSYVWEKNGVTLGGVATPTLPRNLFSKHDIISVIVQKGKETGRATVVIGNSLPKVTSISLQPVDIHKGVDVTAVPVAADADGDNVRFEGAWSVNGKVIDNNSMILPGGSFQRGDQISFEVRTFDDEGAGPPFKTKTITIPNAQPYFVSFPPAKFEGGVYTYQASAVDPDGDTLTYSLSIFPQGMSIDPATGVIVWHVPPVDSGTHQIEIVVRDTEGAQVSQKYSVNLTRKNRTAS
jgi:hypothetical protein